MLSLLDHAKTILHSSDTVYAQKDYTSATILCFKALFCALDHLLLTREGRSPKDHNERFRMLQNSYPEHYTLLDKHFQAYRDTYTTTTDKATCDRIRTDVKKLIEQTEQ